MEPQDREEAYLANAAGDEVTLPACPWNRKEAYLADIGDRINDLEEEIETIKDNPDVADIVDTYADLESYDTSTLTDKDVIRVLNDETHDGNSTYYRYSKATDSFTYIGSSKTYDVFTGTDGTTAGAKGLVPAPATTDAGKYLKADGTWGEAGSAPIQSISVNGTAVTPDENKNVALTIPTVNDATLTITQNGTSAGTFTANASTDATIALTDTTYSAFTGATASTAGTAGLVPAPAAGDESKVLKGDGTWTGLPDGIKTLTTADYNYPTNNPTSVGLWLLPSGIYKIGQGVGVRPNTGTNSQDWSGQIISVSISSGDATILSLIGRERRFTTAVSNGTDHTQNYTASAIATRLEKQDVVDALTSTSVAAPLSANQGKVLKDLIDSIAIRGAGAPATSTVGTVGQLYEDGTNGDLYQLKSIDITVTPNTYNWEEVGGGGGGGSDVFVLRVRSIAGGAEVIDFDADALKAAIDNKDPIVVDYYPGNYYPNMRSSYVVYNASYDSTKAYLYGSKVSNATQTSTDTTGAAITNRNITVTLSNGSVSDNSATTTVPSISVVQTTGTSTTDVMSQNAVTGMVYADPGTTRRVQIGNATSTSDDGSIAIGSKSQIFPNAKASATEWGATAIGTGATATGYGSVSIGGMDSGSPDNAPHATAALSIALGYGASATTQGEMNIGAKRNWGYNNSNYRLISGVYDGQSAHDAATKGQLDTAVINGGTTAPTSVTVGAVGTQYTYVDTTGTPTAHLCVCTEIDNTDPSNPVYTWSTLI